MATFIPDKPYITKSNSAEQRFFYILKKKLTIPGAYVFHSIGLPVYKDKIFGEADFVIVCKRGVLCLEVKGGAGTGKTLMAQEFAKQKAAEGKMYSFKGLDSPIVVLADSEAKPFYEDMQLLYTGISRANAKLYLLMRRDTYENMKGVLQ